VGKGLAPAVPGQPVLAPGVVGRRNMRNMQTRKAKGVPIDDTTVAQLREAAKSVGVSVSARL
jgi:LDH2 family malate/lactate/ureidoglycolate dehydrogenase